MMVRRSQEAEGPHEHIISAAFIGQSKSWGWPSFKEEGNGHHLLMAGALKAGTTEKVEHCSQFYNLPPIGKGLNWACVLGSLGHYRSLVTHSDLCMSSV